MVGLTLIYMFHHCYPANSAIFPSAQAELGRQWNDQCQPNPAQPHLVQWLSFVTDNFVLIADMVNSMTS